MRKGIWLIIGIGIAISLVAAGVVSFYASSSPDGLEKVAEQHGFIDQAQDSANATLPTADYAIAGVENERLSVGLSGVLGVAVMILVAFGLFWLIARGRKPSDPGPQGGQAIVSDSSTGTRAATN
jgi:flagellar basal body-associated protein FliL